VDKRPLIVYTVVLAAILGFAGFSFFGRPDKDQTNIDGFIKTTRVNPRVLVVSLGYDAVTAITSQKGIVVVDAGMSNSLTAKYRRIIETTFGRNDFIYLINTHSHQDHTGGNQVFSDATIVGHQSCPAEMTAYWKDREKIRSSLAGIIKKRTADLKGLKAGSADWIEIFCKKACSQYAYDDLAKGRLVTIPNRTFQDSLTLPLGDMTLCLFYFGPAHSRSDIFIHIPELKLLLTGDLFSKGGYASLEKELLTESPATRKRTVKWLLSRWDDIETVIGGHGQVMNRDDLKIFLDRLEEPGGRLLDQLNF